MTRSARRPPPQPWPPQPPLRRPRRRSKPEMNPSALSPREGAARGLLSALLLGLVLWLAALPGTGLAAEIKFPALTGRVVDDAQLLTPEQEQALTGKLATLEQQTGDQLVVVTLPSLQDQEIEDFGYQLGRHWGIGQKENDGGALLIVAPNERKVRIEVGYGLEGVLTDAYSSLIIRNDILPALQTHWPAAAVTLAATARRLQEADELLQEVAAESAAVCVDADGKLAAPALQQVSPARQRLVLRYWLQQQGFRLPDEAVLAQVAAVAMSRRKDAAPLVMWPGCEVRRYRQHLYAMTPLAVTPSQWSADWDMRVPLCLPDGRVLHAEGWTMPNPSKTVRFRQGGERLRGHGLSHDLKKLLQSVGVPPWERQRLPLVFSGTELMAVAGTNLRSPAWPSDVLLRIEPAST